MTLESNILQTAKENAISKPINDALQILAYLHNHPKPKVVRVHQELPGYHLQMENYHSKAIER